MIKKYFIVSLMTGCLSFSLAAEETPDVYKVGEKLKYIIHYGLVRGGKANLSIKNYNVEGKQAYHVVLSARTVGFVKTMYKIKDVYESFINPDTDLPFKAIRNIREGSYRKYNEIEFDQKQQIANSKLTGKHKVPENIQDILSAFYYARKNLFTPELKKGDIITIQTFFSDELFPLQIRFMGYETVNNRLGKIKCYKFLPVVQTGRIFENDDDMIIWISADQNKIPVRVQFNLFIGSLKCDLVGYSGLTNDFKIE